MDELRIKQVAQMVNDLEEEGVKISVSDEVMLRAYVLGKISGRDLLAHVAQFSDLTAYQDWLHVRIDKFSLAKASHVSVEQLIREVQSELQRKGKTNQAKVADTPAMYRTVTAIVLPFHLKARVPSIFRR